MTDRYAVIGNPVAHSRSPQIQTAFAAATGQDIAYVRELAPLDGFTATVRRLASQGLRGANVTVPFKEEAFRLADELSPRARAAGAANTLRFGASGIYADNTDGAGLVADLTGNLACAIAGRRLLLVGAGGAARGVLQPLLDQRPAALIIANRTFDRAQGLAALAIPAAGTTVAAQRFADLAGQRFDVVINATSASLAGDLPPLPAGLFAPGALACDMMYGAADTPFMAWARNSGAARVADGLGMLVEQAAEAFLLWRGVRPDTAAVLAAQRAALSAQS